MPNYMASCVLLLVEATYLSNVRSKIPVPIRSCLRCTGSANPVNGI